jgi:flagellar hook protein FlgE
MAISNSLNSGVNGIKTFSKSLEVIGDNIANVNTTGFKGSRVTNQDNFSETLKYSSTGVAGGAAGNNSMQIGSGSSVASISQEFTQGVLNTTGGPTDLGISGKGFFTVKSPSGEYCFSRAGDFRLDTVGNLLTSNGYNVCDITGASITIPVNSSGTPPKPLQSFRIDKNGEIFATYADTTPAAAAVNTIGLTSFANPNALMRIGNNLLTNGTDTTATARTAGPAGATAATTAALNLNYGDIIQGTLELSNVDLTEQFSDLIVAQRSFQANSRIVTVSDSVLEEVVNLKR